MKIQRFAIAATAVLLVGSTLAWAVIGNPTEVGVFGKVIAVNGVYVGANGSTLAVSSTGTVSGNAATATALAANGANCAALSFPLGVDASGAAESCSTSISGNAATATALAANGANCSAGTYPKGVSAAGAAESCTAVSLTADVSGIVPKANGGTAADMTNVTFPSTGTIPVIITGTASVTPGSITASQCADSGTTITVTGAAVGDACSIGTPAAGAGTHIVASCYISATSVATARFCNVNTGAQTGTTGTYRATVIH